MHVLKPRILIDGFAAWCFAALLVMLAFPASALPVGEVSTWDESGSIVQLRLRITWGGGLPGQWSGSIQAPNARFSRPTILGIDPESAAGIRVSDQTIEIRQHHASTFEGIDVDITGGCDAALLIRLSTDQQTEPEIHTTTLGELVTQSRVFQLDEQQNRVSLSRAPGDQIAFVPHRPHLVFSPGEEFAFSFQVRHVARQDLTGDCRMEVFRARSQDAALSSRQMKLSLDAGGSTAVNEQRITVPATEGVYDLRISLSPTPPAARGAEAPTVPIVRHIQFVVLTDHEATRSIEPEWRTVFETGPADMRQTVSRQWNQITRLIGMQSGTALGNFEIAGSDVTSSVRLPLGGWQLVPLEIADLEAPHLIEIEYETDRPMALGFSVLQPDETGQIPAFGFDSGVRVPDSIVKLPNSNGRASETHAFSFWPTSNRPFLLIANRSQSAAASYRNIRVSRRQPVQKTGEGKRIPPPAGGSRRLMVFCEQPLFAENFAVADYVDQQLGQSINDWLTFYEGAARLIDHLQATGAGGAFINVYGEGSSLMPLVSTATTPRFDSGVFASDGRDPVRKDVLEMLYRMFDRAGLDLVPVVTFNHRLSTVEFARSDDANDGRVVDYHGRHRRAGQNANFPVYNPLDSSVQQQVNAILQEVADRYRNQSGWRGLAVMCRPDTYTLLPGSRMAGYDRATLSRFVQSLPEPADHSPEISTALTDENYSRWLDWRVAAMSQWYRQMETIVSAGDRQAKLYLALIDLFRNEEISSMLAPSLHRPADMSEALHRLGLSRELARETGSGIVLMQPHRMAPAHPLASKKCECSVEAMRQLDNWFEDCHYSASHFSHRTTWARFESLESSQYFENQRSPIVRLQQLEPAGGWNRERFARALLVSDARLLVDGGSVLSTNQDRNLSRFIQTFNMLPDIPFENVPHATSPDEIHGVAVRYLNGSQATWLYTVNGSPWPTDVIVDFNRTPGRNVPVMVGSDRSSVDLENADRQMRIRIAPFDLVACQLPDPAIRIESFRYTLPSTARRDLDNAYYRLRSKLLASAAAPPITVLDDPGFESHELSDGWTMGGPQKGFVTFDVNQAFEGQQSLKLVNRQDRNMWIRSNWFRPPETGRLSISVWLKIDDEQHQPPLRISLESSDTESGYYRFGEVGSLNSDGKRNQLTTCWKKFAVHFDDLPQDGLDQLRIGFDMMGPGHVWIDRVQLFDRWLDENDVKAMTQLLASVGPLIQRPDKMERCRQVLNGYWPTFLREYFSDDSDQRSDAQATDMDTPTRSTMRLRFRRFVSPGLFPFR